MIPLRDVIPSRTTPWVTLSLIAANALVFIYVLTLSPASARDFLAGASLTPAEFSWLAAFTSMFVHPGWLPVVTNLTALWIFGDNVEDRMGHGRFLLFYLTAGLAAALTTAWAVPGSPLPLLGASGAVAGLLSGYFLEFPHSRVLVLIPLVFVYWEVIEVPAVLLLAVWLLLHALGGLAAPLFAIGPAPWALIGGAAAGLIGARLFERRERRGVDWWGA